MALFTESFWGANGFEELRKYMKQGADFSKDIVSILQERSELEATYAKGLQKLSHRLSKSSREIVNKSTAYVWQQVSTVMESEADLHKNLSVGLLEDIAKQLKLFIENQQKIRKITESSVDKATKILNERRADESKLKKQCFSCAKESEKLQDFSGESRNHKKNLSEKDVAKVEKHRKKAEEQLNKNDAEYFALCLRSERARQERELKILKAQEDFQCLEEERLNRLQDFVQKYSNHLSIIGPRMIEECGRLTEAIATLDIHEDLNSAVQSRGTGPNIPEQILPDFYAEDLLNSMRKEKRRELLEKYSQMVHKSLEHERRAETGVRTLTRGLSSTQFTDSTNQQDLAAELSKMESTCNYLEAFEYRVQCVRADINSQSRPNYPLAVYVEQQRDKQGVVQVILKVPPWSRQNGNSGLAEIERSNSVQSHRGSLSYSQNIQVNQLPPDPCLQILGRCRALYVYDGTDDQELTIRPGDIITLKKKEDEWWHGELNGREGYFPASYVEEI